jgi:4-hydroxy-tetrahydrodipicolinate synthase
MGVALVTPFDDQYRIDFNAHERVVNHVIEGGVNYLVVIGTTGESVVLSREEKQELIHKTIHFAADRVPVVAGFGGNNTRSVVDDLSQFDLNRVDAILSVSPAYNKPTQDGIYAHYEAIAGATHLPIILYNVPGRTSSNIEVETTLRLARDFSNIIALKEASVDLEQITQLAKHKPEDFHLLSGSDDVVLHEMMLGFDGVISVAGNVIPGVFSAMIRHCLNEQFEAASAIHKDIYDFISMLFVQGNPAGAKCGLNHLGLCEEYVRLPLVPVKEALRQKIGAELKRITG